MPTWDLKESSVRVETFEEGRDSEGKTKYGLKIAGFKSYPSYEMGGEYSGPARIKEEDIDTLKEIITKYETYRDAAKKAENI